MCWQKGFEIGRLLLIISSQGQQEINFIRQEVCLSRVFIFFAVIISLILSPLNASANILSNKVEANPRFSKNIKIYLVDLSRSVEKETVLTGLESIREQIANVYGDQYSSPALSYYFWVPVRGVNDRKFFEPIFNAEIDKSLWVSVRSQVGGRANQINVLEKLRTQGGLWSRLISSSSINGCANFVMSQLSAPGLFGKSLANVSRDVCNQATRTRNGYAKMKSGVESYLSGQNKTSGGSDILGAIAKLDDEINRKSGLASYSKIELIFVSDGLHSTPALNLKRSLLSSPGSSCNLGRNSASSIKYDPRRVSVRMYGIGEGRSTITADTEALRAPLREFWQCFWGDKGIDKLEFGQLEDLGMG